MSHELDRRAHVGNAVTVDAAAAECPSLFLSGSLGLARRSVSHTEAFAAGQM